MKVLYILKHNPWGIGGGCYASKSYLYAFLKVFDDADFTIIICSEYRKSISPEILSDKKLTFVYSPPLSNLNCIREFLHLSNHRHRRKVKECLEQNVYDYCIFDHSSLAGSIVDYLPLATKSIVIHHNYEPKFFMDNNSVFKSILLLPIISHNEKHAYKKCSYNIFLTKEDKLLFCKKYGKLSNVYVIGGFESEDIKKISTGVDERKIVITGSLSNMQNEDGILYYLNELHKCVPIEYNVVIAGKKPTKKIVTASKRFKNVTIVDSPKDMFPIISDAKAYICPTRLGSGIKIRIKDALRNGVPVLAHDVSSQGYSDFIDANLMLSFSNPQNFKDGLEIILKFDYTQRMQIYSLFKQNFSFASGCSKIKKMIKNV